MGSDSDPLSASVDEGPPATSARGAGEIKSEDAPSSSVATVLHGKLTTTVRFVPDFTRLDSHFLQRLAHPNPNP